MAETISYEDGVGHKGSIASRVRASFSGHLPDLHIKDTSPRDGGQAFAGINYGTVNYAAPEKAGGTLL